MADEAPRKGQGIERARAIWRRRQWLAIPAFVLLMIAAVTLVLTMPSVFESRALVLVDRQQVPEEFVRSTVTSALEVRLRTRRPWVAAQPFTRLTGPALLDALP